jgi:hypothetical protein
MTIRLWYWNRAFKRVEIEAKTGAWRVLWQFSQKDDAHTPCRGFGLVHRRNFYACYELEGQRFLQFNNERWNITHLEATLDAVSERCNRLTVTEHGKVVFAVQYMQRRHALLNRIDPTFDETDEAQDDFFMWLDRNIQEAKPTGGH